MTASSTDEDAQEQPTRPWADRTLPPRRRAELLVGTLDLDQKIAQLHGAMETINIAEVATDMQLRIERHVDAVPEAGIPRFRVTNGPVGVGQGDGTPSPAATSLPVTIALAAGFDRELAHAYGDIIGSETATLGQHVLEGPGVCLHRTPLAGRNFEYFSEDPYLSGVMGVEVARAIQAHGVIAMAKHYVLNDQEHERFRANVEIEERVLRELYLLPFEMLVKDADIAAVMSSYNRVRGTYATENRYILDTILREEWGFEGYVQSDFWSCRSAAPAINAGMDHEMPDAKWLNPDNVTAALSDTSLEIETIDRALMRRYTQMFRFGQFERPYDPGTIDAAAHGAESRRIGEQTAVLLKNEDAVLPLPTDLDSIAVVGLEPFVHRACLGGGGSSKVVPLYTVDPLTGLRDVLDESGSATEVVPIVVQDDLSNLDEVRRAASRAGAVVIIAGLVSTEGEDRPDARLPDRQDELIEALLDSNPRTVLVLKDSSPVLMPWISRAPAVLEAWNQGSEDGHVVASLLLGTVNPSGKLPTTYPRTEEDTFYAGHPERYPGVVGDAGYPEMTYSEGLEMGYRWYQSRGIAPLFPFGFGLSYTSFVLSDLAISSAESDGRAPLEISFTVANTGDRAGAEVVQVYLGLPGSSGRPPKRLVGFTKVSLDPGEAVTATVAVDPTATHHPFSVWDDGAHAFVLHHGACTVHVGTSSDDTPLTAEVLLTPETAIPSS